MNPMDFFNRKDGGYPFYSMPQPEFTPENMHDLKKKIRQYQSVLNEEFWGDIQGLGTRKRNKIQIIPIEIWESDENVFLLVAAPGLSTINHAKIIFQNDQILTLKIKTHSMKPAGAHTILDTEFPQHSYEREIFLKVSVITSDYSSSYEDGVLTYVFRKVKDTLDIPFDF
ncbi:hypothetical protein IM538_04485 [Cytobacillus suaedae]|nr:hypothetical protein IM538_04485 [Cytobacillus suaedae]